MQVLDGVDRGVSDRSPVLAAIALGAGGFALVSAVLWNVLYPVILSAA